MTTRPLLATLVATTVLALQPACSRENAAATSSTAAGKEASAPLDWKTDVAAALEQARAEKKIVLLNFTGSDWCVWCHRLDGEVFSTPTFRSYAAEKLVLVKVDFPRGRKLPEAEQRQNRALAEKHGIEGFPTIVILDANGTTLGKLGYLQGGPDAWLAELGKLTRS